nr:MAG TPA: hypothetical protein [Caudoviricetes sp.]
MIVNNHFIDRHCLPSSMKVFLLKCPRVLFQV